MPRLCHVWAFTPHYPPAPEEVQALERDASYPHATTARTAQGQGAVLFLTPHPEQAETLRKALSAPVVVAIPTDYDHVPYIYPVGFRVRADEDIPQIPRGTPGTVTRHHDEHSFVVTFDNGAETVAFDYQLWPEDPNYDPLAKPWNPDY